MRSTARWFEVARHIVWLAAILPSLDGQLRAGALDAIENLRLDDSRTPTFTGRTESRLRLFQPEAHVHLAIHRCGDRQVLGSLCPVTGAVEQLAQVEVAVGGQRAHLELIGPGEGLGVVPLG